MGHGTLPCFTSWRSSPPPHPRGLSVARALWGAGVLPQWQHGGRGGAGGEWEFQHPQGCTHLASHQRDNPSDPP